MAVDLAQLAIEVRSDGVLTATNRLDRLERQSGKTERATGRISAGFRRVDSAVQRSSKAVGAAALVMGAAMTGAAAKSIQLAIEAEETAQKFRVVFRGSVESVDRQLQELTATVPLAITEMRGLAASLQDMLVPMGVARDEASQMSVEMVRLAGDMAAFNNQSPEKVLMDMQSALAGSSEPMRKYGVDTRITRLETIALRDGLIEQGEEMDNAAMAAAALTAITEDTADAHGYAEREVGNAAAQLRFLSRDIKQAQEDFGRALLPTLSEVTGALNETENGMSNIQRIAVSLMSIIGQLTKFALLLSNGFQTVAKRMAQVAAIGNELVETFSPDFEFSDLWTPGAGLSKLIGGLREGADNAGNMADRIGEINRAANEDIEGASDTLNSLILGIDESLDMMQTGVIEVLNEMAGLGDTGGEALKDVSDGAGEASEKIEELAEAQETFMASVEDIEASLAGDTATAMLEYRRSVAEANQLFAEGAITLGQYMRALDAFQGQMNQGTGGGQGMFPDFGVLDSALDGMKDIREEMEEAAQIEWSFEGLIDSFHPLSQAMRQLGDDIELINARIESGNLSQMEGMFMKTGVAANAAFGAIMSGMDRSSKEYQQMEVAQQAVNVALGIAAILQQGMGDPYTAIPRMIAMAAMVAQLVDGISGLSGGGGGAEARQERQGTGSVLGDTEAKSESIANAVEITADATSELVGINRGMLHALNNLQEGLSGAAGMVARGAGQFDASGINIEAGGFESLMGDIHQSFDPIGAAIDDFIGGLFGFGDTEIVDQGIALLGGAITDMTEGAVAQAFADLERDSLFGSKSKTAFEDLDEAFSDQLNLIFASMIDTVTQAGEALGIPLEEIQSRIEQFEVAAQEISLMDLDAEEQQAELEAVFSRIFDDLATSVIPFIDQFQKIGEGMGETLVRVATSVQVAQEAIMRLGLNISDSLGPERMAQVSVGLIEAAGGIENFITDMESFMSAFAPEAHQFEVAQSDITRALEQMNVELPESREGFWELMQSIDGTTEAGQQQIATLLSLTDAADTFYSNLEDIQQEREGLERRLMELHGQTAELRRLELQELDESNRALQERIWALEDEQELADMMSDVSQNLLQELSPAHASLNQLMTTYNNMLNSARELGASEEQLMRIRQLHSAQLDAMAQTLRAGIGSAVEDLFGDASSSMSSTASSVDSSMKNIRDSMIRALEGVRDWLDSSMLSDTSPLMPEQRLGEAQRQFDQTINAALGGDVDAMGDLPGLADQLLSEAGGFFGTSTSEFDKIWMQVREAMSQVGDMDVPDARPPTRGQTANIESSTESTAKSAYQQMLQAQNLIGQIDVLSRITGDSPADIAKELDVPMGKLIELMGDSPENTASALGEQFNNLVTDFGESLNPLMGIEQSQLAELRALNTNMATWLGSTAQLEEPNEGSRAFMPKDDPVLTGSSSDKGSEETNERLGRLEEALESIARSTSQTANASERSASGVNDLVINERVRNSRNQATRLR